MVNGVNNSRFFDMIVDTNSLLEGHFYYTGEYHTRYCIDTDLIFQHPKYVDQVGEALYELFKSSGDIKYVITPNYRGGILLAHNVAERFNAKVILLGRERGIINISPEMEISGKGLIIDDLINTGDSLKQLLKLLSSAGVDYIGAGIFVDRYVGNLEMDFRGLVKALLHLKQEAYEIIDTTRVPCRLCQEFKRVAHALESETDDEARKDLVRLKNIYEVRCAYGDAQ